MGGKAGIVCAAELNARSERVRGSEIARDVHSGVDLALSHFIF